MRNYNVITHKHLEKAYTYQTYRKLIDDLLKQGKTTGNNHSEQYVKYTKLNVQRMNRWDKNCQIFSEFEKFLKYINKKIIMVVLTEAWCGDTANLIPVFEKIRLVCPEYLSLYLLLRDENPDVMEDNLTNGARSIPKLIFLNENLEKLATWGPRPQPLSQQIQEWKNQGLTYSQFADKIQLWYAHDKSLTTQKEIFDILKSLIL